jgi:hypothetical protein
MWSATAGIRFGSAPTKPQELGAGYLKRSRCASQDHRAMGRAVPRLRPVQSRLEGHLHQDVVQVAQAEEGGNVMTFDARNVLAFVFAKIGQDPEDELMVKAADACFGAATALLSAIDSDAIRERAITERDAKTIDLIRNMAAMLDAVHHGDLQVERKN